MVFVLLLTCFAGCKKTENTKTNSEDSESKSENSTTELVESVAVTDDNGEPVTDESCSTVTEAVTQSDNANSSPKASNVAVSNSQTESSTKKTASSGSQSKKPSNNTKPVTTTKKNNSSVKSTTEPEIYTTKYCSNGNHQWGSWVVEDGQNHYRTCKNCPAEDYNDKWEWKPEYHMGNKSEYMELLALVNNARKDRGLKPFTYKSEWQAGADQRAVDLTQNFSHKRPDGRPLYTAYTDHGFDCFSAAECCAKGYGNAKAVFNGWKNSEKHWAALMNETPQDVVISRCDTYWVFSFPI